MTKKLNPLVIPFLFAFLLAITSLSSPTDTSAQQAEITRSLYLLGDSWTAQMHNDFGTFQSELEARNLNDTVQIVSMAESGSTAEGWVNDDPCNPSCAGRFTALKTAIENDPLANPVVFFTLGGNDLLAAFQGGPSQSAFEPIGDNLRTIVSELKQVRDDVTIYIGGYDILNPAINEAQCNFLLNFVFGSTDPSVSNPYQIQLQDTITAIAGEFTNVTAINTYGSLQGTPGSPDVSTWSDVQYIQDCIHLNGPGYEIYIDTVFDAGLETTLASTPVDLTETIYLPIVR